MLTLWNKAVKKAGLKRNPKRGTKAHKKALVIYDKMRKKKQKPAPPRPRRRIQRVDLADPVRMHLVSVEEGQLFKRMSYQPVDPDKADRGIYVFPADRTDVNELLQLYAMAENYDILQTFAATRRLFLVDISDPDTIRVLQNMGAPGINTNAKRNNNAVMTLRPNDVLIRNSFRDTDYKFVKWLCKTTQLDGYYASSIGDFHAEVVVCPGGGRLAHIDSQIGKFANRQWIREMAPTPEQGARLNSTLQ